MRKLIALLTGAVLASVLTTTSPTVARATLPHAGTPAATGTCAAVDVSPEARTVSAEETAQLESDPQLMQAAQDLGVPASQLASEAAAFLTGEEIAMTVSGNTPDGTVSSPGGNAGITPMETFRCAEARVGYYLFNVWGMGICAVFGAGTGGIGGAVCSLVLVAGGGEIDFNSVCD